MTKTVITTTCHPERSATQWSAVEGPAVSSELHRAPFEDSSSHPIWGAPFKTRTSRLEWDRTNASGLKFKHISLGIAAVLFTGLIALAQEPPPGGPPPPDSQPNNGSYTFKVNSDLVLTNVVVRDKKTGEVVRGLKASDFTILENGKPQKISTFDFESVDQATPLNEATVSGMAGSTTAKSPTQNHRRHQRATPQSPPHRLLLRPHLDATRGHRPLRRRCQELRQQTDAARRPGRRRLAKHQPLARSGFHRQQGRPAPRRRHV